LIEGINIKILTTIIDFFDNGDGKKLIRIWKSIKSKISYFTLYFILISFIIQEAIAFIFGDKIILFSKDVIKQYKLNENESFVISHLADFLNNSNIYFLIGATLILLILFFLQYSDIIVRTQFKTLKKASCTIKKILDDNKRIFKSHGPNSSLKNIDDIRNNEQLATWNTIKEKKIIPNNKKIYTILENIERINDNEVSHITSMKNHIEAFQNHVLNKNVDYTKHQFPTLFAILITKYCNNGILKDKYFENYLSWIQSFINEHRINVKYKGLFGSALYDKKPNDIDILIYMEENDNSILLHNSQLLNQMGKDFERNFNKELHQTVFTKNEETIYKDFKYKLLDIKEF